MMLRLQIAVAVGWGLMAAVSLGAQSTPPAKQPPASPQQPAGTQQQAPAQKPSSNANPFPEDTNSVPVVPTTGEAAPVPPPAVNEESAGTTSLLKDDSDPVHSPDDPPPGASDSDSGFSSSLTGTNDVNIPDEMKPGKHGKKADEPPVVHQETAKEDEDVGAYELSLKHWKAALSRYQSALVTDPDNPDVYWGMAEAQRELKDFAKAKANYQKVTEYDPDSKHGKEAKKLLKDPELANAPAVSAIPAATTKPTQP